jgi:AraC-like DNA-binding protein
MNQHDYFELVFLASGKLTWQVQDRFFTQRQGDLFLVSSWLYHRITGFSSPPVKLIQLSFLPEVVRSDCAHGEDATYLLPFLQQDSRFRHVVPAKTGIPAHVVDLMLRIERRLPATSDLNQLSVKTCLRMILVLLIENYSNLPDSVKAAEDRHRAVRRLRPVFELFEQHYAEPIHLGDAASAIGMSRSRFTHFFKHVCGESFVRYLNHFRVAHAEKLLRLTGEPLSQVCQKVGFCDQSYFGRVFRRFTNLTPGQYHRKYGRSAKKRVALLIK